MNPLVTQQRINAAHDARIKSEMDSSFGTGSRGGDPNWEPPVHASTRNGKAVTVSFGRGGRTGHTLIADGHVGMREFYEKARDGKKGHDHYLPNGEIAGKDRGRFTE